MRLLSDGRSATKRVREGIEEMVSTVTTTVVSVITTASGAQLVTALGLAAVLTLIASLVIKELTAGAERGVAKTWGRNLNLVISPLLFVFVFIVAAKVVQVLA